MKKTVLIGLWFLASTVVAQEKPNSTILTFKDAVKIGLDNNLNLNQQKNQLTATKVTKSAGLLSFGPSVNVNGNAGRNDGNSFNQQQGRVINGVLDFVNTSIDANMPLFQGLNVLNSYRASSSAYEAQLHFVQRSSQDVIRDVSRQFLTVLLDQRLVFINERNVETQLQQYNQIKEFVNAGTRAEVDLKNQEFQLKNAELLLVRAKNTLRNDKAILAQTLQLDPTLPFDLQEPDWTFDKMEININDLYATAGERRSDLKRAEELEKSAQYTFSASKSAYFPNLSLFASYGSAYNYVYRTENMTPEQYPSNRGFKDQFTEDNTQLTYGVSFRIPIYNAFQNRSNIIRSKMAYENSKLQKENTEIIVKSEVMLAHQNLQDAKAAFEAASSQLEAAETSNALEKERYALGISDIVALTQSNQILTRAQSDFESARYTLMFQDLLINYAVGTLNFDDIP
ncbi:MAG TPA: TolC family protein [Chryseosolibacter sp.]|nr:TolC family protein [Chryseosolibacter sp.]